MIWIAGLWSFLVGAKKAQEAYDMSSFDDYGTKGTSKLPTANKTMLVVGDSHTAAPNSWGEAIKNKYKLASLSKVAANGKTTKWMLDNLKTYLSKNRRPDYIFIWGGTNDAYGTASKDESLQNIQEMVNLGNSKGSKVIIVTGYEPTKVSTSFDLSKMYRGATESDLKASASKLSGLYKALPSSIKGAYAIIPPYPNFSRTDSTDGIHLKMPNYKILGEYIGSKVF